MPSCPECRTRLDAPLYEAEACPRGHGVHLSQHAQQRVLPRRAQEALAGAEPLADDSGRPCAACATRTRGIRVAAADTPIHVDRCEACGGLWFDGDELVRLTRAHRAIRPSAWVARDPRSGPAAIEILLWSFA